MQWQQCATILTCIIKLHKFFISLHSLQYTDEDPSLRIESYD